MESKQIFIDDKLSSLMKRIDKHLRQEYYYRAKGKLTLNNQLALADITQLLCETMSYIVPPNGPLA